MGFPIGNAISIQGMLAVVGAMFGPASVVVFSTSRTITRFVWQFLNSISNTICVELSSAFGSRNTTLARMLHRQACQAAFWIASPSCIVLYFLGPWIMHAWTGGKVAFNKDLFAVLLLVVVCNSFWTISYSVSLSVNRHQTIALLYVTSTALSLGTTAFLIRYMHFGMIGAGLGLLIIDALMTTFVVRRSLSLVQDSMFDFCRYVLTPPVSTLQKLLAHTKARLVQDAL
jgi:O-antigen/teichoic acid export membrane protein